MILDFPHKNSRSTQDHSIIRAGGRSAFCEALRRDFQRK